MKSVIYFSSSGIHEEREVSNIVFKISEYPEFDSYKECADFLILYNSLSTEHNCVELPFTTDMFNGSILVIKIGKNNKIITFPFSKYLTLLNVRRSNSRGREEGYSSDSSDEDPFSNSCNLKRTEC